MILANPDFGHQAEAPLQCRFVKDLPPGLDAMNDHLVSAAFPPEVQPVQEIMQILQAATRQPDL